MQNATTNLHTAAQGHPQRFPQHQPSLPSNAPRFNPDSTPIRPHRPAPQNPHSLVKKR